MGKVDDLFEKTSFKIGNFLASQVNKLPGRQCPKISEPRIQISDLKQPPPKKMFSTKKSQMGFSKNFSYKFHNVKCSKYTLKTRNILQFKKQSP